MPEIVRGYPPGSVQPDLVPPRPASGARCRARSGSRRPCAMQDSSHQQIALAAGARHTTAGAKRQLLPSCGSPGRRRCRSCSASRTYRPTAGESATGIAVPCGLIHQEARNRRTLMRNACRLPAVHHAVPACRRAGTGLKPPGSFWRMVCSITWGTGEADMSARRSAMFRSSSMANDAVTPPVVDPGEHAQVRDAGPVEPGQRRADLRHLHERQDPLHHPCAARGRHRGSAGSAFSSARSMARAIFPTTDPMLPPMNCNRVATTTSMPCPSGRWRSGRRPRGLSCRASRQEAAPRTVSGPRTGGGPASARSASVSSNCLSSNNCCNRCREYTFR